MLSFRQLVFCISLISLVSSINFSAQADLDTSKMKIDSKNLPTFEKSPVLRSKSTSASEWSSLFSIIVMSAAMFAGGYLAGLLPLFYTLSEDKILKVSFFGAGLLVGSALAVIIPEGIGTIHEATNQQRSLQPHSHLNAHSHAVSGGKSAAALDTEKLKAEVGGIVDHKHHSHTAGEEKPEHEDHAGHQVVGLVLVVGFAFMLLIDQLGGPGGHSHGGSAGASTGPLSGSASTSQLSTAFRRSRSFTATLGLILHALADGIALGAAACTGQSHIQAVVFIAIMLHKAPNGFGLVSYLLHEGLETRRIKRHLLFFSCSAPSGAMLTFFFLKSIQHLERRSLTSEQDPTDNTAYLTGLAMLFSAGTFLYAALHTLILDLRTFHLSTVLLFRHCLISKAYGLSHLFD